jgi:citrate lyase subunit gamma (acyl carrier protein)
LAVIKRVAQAGTVESSDIMITLSPAEADGGIEIELESPVLRQFGRQIRSVLETALTEAGVTAAKVYANDKGALDCTIRARLKTALNRALEEEVKA